MSNMFKQHVIKNVLKDIFNQKSMFSYNSKNYSEKKILVTANKIDSIILFFVVFSNYNDSVVVFDDCDEFYDFMNCSLLTLTVYELSKSINIVNDFFL